MWNSNRWVSWAGSSSAVSGHHVAGGESGSGSGSELLGSRDALESPGLWGWLDNGIHWESWVVSVGGGGSELAGLDTELGSVLQECLSGTAAKWLAWFSLETFLSWGLGYAFFWLGVVAKGTDRTISGHGSHTFVGSLDFGGLVGSGGLDQFRFFHGGLGHMEGSDLALGLGHGERGGGHIEVILEVVSAGDESVILGSYGGTVIAGPLHSSGVESLLLLDGIFGNSGGREDSSGSCSNLYACSQSDILNAFNTSIVDIGLVL